jgi:capsular exopolysaccharide synthesis family protein
LSKNFELLQRAQKEQESLRAFTTGANGGQLALRTETFTAEEAVRLVQRLFLVPGPDAPRAVVFSGVNPGDGCSTICTCVAETLAAQVGTPGTFCLVDANLRAPSLDRYFGLENRTGLAEAISQPGPVRSFAQQVNGGRLWVMTSGSAPSNIHALLTSEGLRARMADLRAEFDNVLIDVPPISLYADAITLGKLSDGIILVLQSNATRREAARKAKETIETAQVPLIGAVLNRRRFPVPPGLYGKL